MSDPISAGNKGFGGDRASHHNTERNKSFVSSRHMFGKEEDQRRKATLKDDFEI